MVRVLKAAAEAFGWTPKAAPSGRGFGVACATYIGTYVATLAEVTVDRATGRVRVGASRAPRTWASSSTLTARASKRKAQSRWDSGTR